MRDNAHADGNKRNGSDKKVFHDAHKIFPVATSFKYNQFLLAVTCKTHHTGNASDIRGILIPYVYAVVVGHIEIAN
jgi:hypothetical protein